MNGSYPELMNNSVVQELPPSASYIPNFITEDEEKNLIKKINSSPLPKWTQLSHRRVQNWGGVPHAKGMIAEEIPNWLQTQIDKIVSLNIFEIDKKPNHVLINEYLSGQGIMAHLDGPLFHPVISTISCGSHTILEFYKCFETENLGSPKHEFSLLLEPRSLLILKKNLYHNYLHSISEKTVDIISNDIRNLHMCSKSYVETQILERTTRLSLTIRHVPKTSRLILKFGK